MKEKSTGKWMLGQNNDIRTKGEGKSMLFVASHA